MTQTQLLYVVLIISALSAILSLVSVIISSRKKDSGTNAGLEKELNELSVKTDKLGIAVTYANKEIDNLNVATERRFSAIQTQLNDDIKYIADSNTKNLEIIRKSVDEKLSSSIDGKLSKSYENISMRLEAMYKNLGEVHSLAANVSDMKKIFSNVKLRGTFGEAQLSSLLSQMLAPNQYASSVKLAPRLFRPRGLRRKIPSSSEEEIWLPIDSKFPTEEYLRLMDAPDKETEAKCLKNLERAVKIQADSISQKYISPPYTTDFAIMYLPTEGLYSEVVRMPGINDFLYSRRIMVCGPANLGAMLSTLQTGFKNGSDREEERRAMEALSSLKTEISRFNELLDKTSKKLQEAQDSIDSASKKTKTIERKLKDVDAPLLKDEEEQNQDRL